MIWPNDVSNDMFNNIPDNMSNDTSKDLPNNMPNDMLNDTNTPYLDIYDPSNWANLDNTQSDILVEKGSIRELNFVFPHDDYNRHFLYAHFYRKLSNGERSDRKWLVYSEHADKVFYFCCKLFKSVSNNGLLLNEGLRDWKILVRDSNNMKIAIGI